MAGSRLSPTTAWAGAALAAGVAAAAFKRSRRKSVAGKVVVITGGSRGLGLALADIFGKHGARLVLAARSEEELREAKRKLFQRGVITRPDQAITVACDLTKPGDPEKLIESAIHAFGTVDVLINSAGVIFVGPIEQQPIDAYFEAMNSNFFSILRTTYAVLPHMLERGRGSIVNIASIGGKIPVPHLAPYTASKFAAVGFSETLHAELKGKGIRVTTVNPGLMRTGSYPNAQFVGKQQEEYDWFSLSASMPGLAHSVDYAARKVYDAVISGRTEIEIGMDAFLAARAHGLSPTLTQMVGSLADQLILPESSGTRTPAKGFELKAPSEGLWKRWSNSLTKQSNQPSA